MDEPVTDVSVPSGGHVNRTYLVKERERYVLQMLNRELYGGCLTQLEHNYEQFARAVRESRDEVGDWTYPRWLLLDM